MLVISALAAGAICTHQSPTHLTQLGKAPDSGGRAHTLWIAGGSEAAGVGWGGRPPSTLVTIPCSSGD